MRRLALAVAATAACMALGGARAARAECRVEVRPFDGPDRHALRDEVVRELAARCKVVEPGRRNGADVVVEGRIRRDRDLLRLKLWVKDARDEELVRTVRVTLDGPTLSRRARRDLLDRLDDVLVESGGDAPARDDEDDDERAGDDEESYDVSTTASKRAKATSKGARVARAEDEVEVEVEIEADDEAAGENDPEDDAEVDDIDPRVFAASGHTVSATATRASYDLRRRDAPRSTVAAGASLVDRSLTFVPRPDLADKPRALDVRTRNVYAAGEVYPLSGSLARLGLGFMVEKELALSLDEAEADVVSGASPSASQLRWGVGLRYHQPVGGGGAAVTLGLGYSELVFEMDRGVTLPAAMAGTPDTHYRFLDPSVAVRVPVASATAVVATARGWLVLDAGEIVHQDAYGQAQLTAFDTELALEYAVAARYPVRLAARYGVVGYDFDGAGARAIGDDGDRATVDIGGASDRYLACALTAGYLW